jgi:hypothetical protein
MKKGLFFVALLIGLFVISFVIFGCGTSTSTTTTTTVLSTEASLGSSTAATVSTVVGLASTATGVGSLAGIKPASVSSVRGFTAGPPAAFFSTFPGNGKITFEGFVSGETVEMQFSTATGTLIDGTFMGARKIASLEGFDWESLKSGFSFTDFGPGIYNWLNYDTDWDPANATKISNFYTNNAASGKTKYRTLDTFWDYIVWAHILTHPSMESSVNAAYIFYPNFPPSGPPARGPLSAYPNTSTPEATVGDKIGSQKAHVTGTHPNGESVDLTQIISVDAQGKPVSSTGEGMVIRADGAIMTIESVSTTFSNGSLASADMDMIVSSPKNFHIVLTMTASGAASGTVFDRTTSPETEKGSLIIFAVKDANGNSGYFEDKATSTKHYF